MTSAAIAEALAMPHGTIRTRLRRARQLLEEALAGLHEDPGLLARTLGDLDGWASQVRQANVGADDADARFAQGARSPASAGPSHEPEGP